MGCKAGKSKDKPEPGRYHCVACGADAKKKEHLCKPKKIKGKVKKK